jgi:quercetin dioxygenase-like cupin family protein
MDEVRDLLPGDAATTAVAGLGFTYRIVGEQTGGTLALIEATLKPWHLGAPPHMHRREDQVLCVVEGELMVQVGERVTRAQPGSVVFKPRGVYHAFWNPGAATARYLDFITPAGFEECLRELAPLLPPDGLADVPAAVVLVARYQVEFDPRRMAEILDQNSAIEPGLWSALLPANSSRECDRVHQRTLPLPVA